MDLDLDFFDLDLDLDFFDLDLDLDLDLDFFFGEGEREEEEERCSSEEEDEDDDSSDEDESSLLDSSLISEGGEGERLRDELFFLGERERPRFSLRRGGSEDLIFGKVGLTSPSVVIWLLSLGADSDGWG